LVIKPSSAGEIARLVDTLLGGTPVEREAAAARLRVLGTRAATHLLADLDRVSPSQQVVLLQVLEGIRDSRILPRLIPLLADPETRAAALAATGPQMASARSAARERAAAALDRLAGDPAVTEETRGAAREALARAAQSRPSVRRGAAAAPDRPPASRAQPPSTAGPANEPADDPSIWRQRLAGEGSRLPISQLHDLVDRLRTRERRAEREPEALEWAAARALAHQRLAERGSRLALYDLRETLHGWHDELPNGFIVAVAQVGDAACLESVATAYERARNGWVRSELVTAFRRILERERLTRRHATVKRAARRSPGLAGAVWGADQ
jgi:hypothetical protein